MISIVIPVFNGEKTIYECLKSIYSQNVELEVIVRDGMSSDNTLHVIRDFTRDFNVNLKLTSEKDKGAADAVKKGLEDATGDILTWLGCDDFLTPGSLKTVQEQFDKGSGIEWIVGACKRIWHNGEVTTTLPNKSQFADILLINPIDQPSSFWSRDLYLRVGGIDVSYKFAFDWDLWCRFKMAGATPLFIQDTLSIYNFSEDNLTSRGGRDQLKEQLLVIEKYSSKKLARYYSYVFENFDLKAYFDGGNISKPMKLKYGAAKLLALALFGRKANKYSLYWLSKQMRGIDVVARQEKKEITVVTACDNNYFTSLLSLVGTLKYPREDSTIETNLVVWDLGLQPDQVKLLTLIDFPLSIRKLNDIFQEPFSGAFSAKDDCFAWKSFAISAVVNESSHPVLWMDAGAAVSRNLNNVYEIITRTGHFLLENKEFLNENYISLKAKLNLKVTAQELKEPQLSATVVGFNNSTANNMILDEWRLLSSDPDLILGDVETHRHDQALLSIVTSRHKLSRLKVEDFAGENSSNIKQAQKMKLTFIFHRRKWQYIDLNLSLIHI